MPAFTFTANSTTDKITATAHGLNTGDGPFAVRNIGGGLPGGLAPVTEYWFIRVDADNGKVATSNANAMAGAALDLTSNGTGTQVLEIGLPYRRPRTYAPGSVLFSSDVNALFDSLIATYDLLTGQTQSIYNGVTLAGSLTANGGISTAALTAGGLITANAGVAAGANQHVTVSGTGRYKHGTRTIVVPVVAPFVSVAPLTQVKATVTQGSCVGRRAVCSDGHPLAQGVSPR